MTDSVAIFPPGFRITDSNGNPASGATINIFNAGTSTPKTVYSDSDLTVSLGAIVTTNSSGEPSSDGSTACIVYTGTAAYKIIVKDSGGTPIPGLSFDNVRGASAIPTASTSALPTTPVSSKTTAYTVTTSDRGKLFNCNCTGGAFAITLPSAVTAGDNFRVGIRHDGTANTVAILAISGQTIGYSGKTSTAKSLSSYGETMWLVSDGAQWKVDTYVPALITGAPGIILITDRLTAPPASPTGGARYIVNGSPTGAWSTLSFAQHDIAEADGNGSWIKITPTEGMLAYITDENLYSGFTGTAWTDFSNITAPTASSLKIAVFADEKSTNTTGGTSVDDTWTKHTLNTTRANTITGCSLASDQITLTTGKYKFDCQISAYAMSEGQIRLYNVTNAAVEAASVQVYTANYTSGTGPASILSGAPIVLTCYVDVTGASEVFELQYYTTVGGVTNSLGRVRNIGSENEVYAVVSILDLTSIQGPAGISGASGAAGRDAGYIYQWSTSTSGDPGSGKIAGNNATVASITQIAVSETDANATSLAAAIATWDDSTSSTRATVRVVKNNAGDNWHEFAITGAGADQGAYWTFPVSYVGTAGTIGNGVDVSVQVSRIGDVSGAAGSTGQMQYNSAGAMAGAAAAVYATSGTHVKVTAQAATDVPVVAKAHASQSANLQEWQNSFGTALAAIDENGYASVKRVVLPGGGDMSIRTNPDYYTFSFYGGLSTGGSGADAVMLNISWDNDGINRGTDDAASVARIVGFGGNRLSIESISALVLQSYNGHFEFEGETGASQFDLIGYQRGSSVGSTWNFTNNGHTGTTADTVWLETRHTARSPLKLRYNDGATVTTKVNFTYDGRVQFGAASDPGTAYDVATAGAILAGSYIKTTANTVAGLTAAATAGAGARDFVTDANATTFASIVAGGGSNGVPVYSDGTNWRIG